MSRRDRRRERARARADTCTRRSSPVRLRRQVPRLRVRADRKALLLGTALASTLLLSALTAPTPAIAAAECTVGGVDVALPPPTTSINIVAIQPIVCVNGDTRIATGAFPDYAAIGLYTVGIGATITLTNDGSLESSGGVFAFGVYASTTYDDSDIDIDNRGDVEISNTLYGYGIRAVTDGENSPITITNSGDIRVDANFNADGIFAATGYFFVSDGPITVTNTGDMDVVSEAGAADGIDTYTYGDFSGISVTNSGDFDITAEVFGNGISLNTSGDESAVTVNNTGDMRVRGADGADGIDIETYGARSPISVTNSGNLNITSSFSAAEGIDAASYSERSGVTVVNSGDLTAKGVYASGIYTYTQADYSPISVTNSGNIDATGIEAARGISAYADGDDSPISIKNSGDVTATVTSPYSYAAAIYASAFAPITIVNSGSLYAKGAYSRGIAAYGYAGHITKIFNTGDISSSSDLAILAIYGRARVYNAGTITGYVVLSGQDDRFINQAGGVFEARKTSYFDAYGPGGNDLFVNQAGATVLAATDSKRSETVAFERLDRFENQGLISMVDGRPGDSFTISNTPGGTDLDFVASGNSRLAVDAFLGRPGKSRADTFTIEGDVSGTTTVRIANTNTGPGTFDSSGIRVITATGATPNPNAFHLDQPVDTGFFDYDLFFTPTGSGYWNLRSFPGGGAFLLPQLITAAQDIWHQSASTWFDRTADLRVLLAGGAAPTAYDPGGGKSLGAAGPYPLTPAVWARGSGSWLDRDDSERTRAYGRNYTIDLDRDLETLDFQVGIDMGKRDVWGQGDALVFGLLGGFVHGDLDYDALARAFNFDGGQVGAYATYLNGGLFVDTLLNVHLYSLDTNTRGFPDSLDANTVGLRTDTGYRFGSFSGGPFLEPLGTLEVTWADIDGFSLGGNGVSFDDDANVRGRLGLRAGTTMEAWQGTLMEPFVVGSLWGNLTDDNSATLVSTGRTFRFEDQLDDIWGELSAGVNFFNFSQTTAVFAKVDVTFGDDLTGLGGKAGMRVNW